ncbi:MAG: MarR family winged helix-turn-helix transcriptional regulator [Janthinobacterium lividum]
MLDEKDRIAVVQQFGRTYRAFMTAFQACVGLPLLQWRILLMLRDLPHAQPQKTLVETLDVDAGALTRQLQQMEQKGWVTRSIDERDNRLTNVALAEKGRQKIAEATPLRDVFLAEATDSLSEERLCLMEETMTLFEARIKDVAARCKSAV